MELKIASNLYLRFEVGLMVMPVIGVVTYISAVRLVNSDGMVGHTHEVLASLDSVVSFLRDAEAGQRGLIITGENCYLEPYNASLSEIPREISRVRDLTSDNPKQQERIRDLEPLVAAKLAELKETIDLRRSEGFEAVRAVVLTDADKQITNELRKVITAMKDEESVLFLEREASTSSTASTVKTTIVNGTIAAFALLGGLAFFLTRSITTPLEAVGNVVANLAYRILPHLSGAAQSVADGNLTKKADNTIEKVDVSSIDEISDMAQGFNYMVDRIGEITSDMNDTADNLATASNKLSSASEQAGGTTSVVASSGQHLVSGADEQPKGVGQTNSVIVHLTSAIDQISDISQEQTSGVEQAETAEAALSDILNSLSAIAGQIEQISSSVDEVSASSTEMVSPIQGANDLTRQNTAAAQHISASSTEVTRSIEDIAAISGLRSATSQEASAEEVSAQVEQVGASTQALDQMAQELQEEVSTFRISGAIA